MMLVSGLSAAMVKTMLVNCCGFVSQCSGQKIMQRIKKVLAFFGTVAVLCLVLDLVLILVLEVVPSNLKSFDVLCDLAEVVKFRSVVFYCSGYSEYV
jgi:hypothetical protein